MKILIFTPSLSKTDSDWFDKLSLDEQKDYLKQHPRSRQKITNHKTVGEKKRTLVETKTVDGKRVMSDGSPLPEHIQKLGIPPGWGDVKIDSNPNADLLVVGKDAKGRQQSIYSESFASTQAQAKFERVQALANEFPSIVKQNEGNRRSKEPRIKDAADCMRLIMETGIRPGSDSDTGAEKKAYGASNLRANHVVIEKGKTYLRFTGKKGVEQNIEIDDPKTAKMLQDRSKAAGTDGKLFPAINEKHLLDYVHTLDGGHFRTKDFRTHLGTYTAMKEIEAAPKPVNQKEYKQAVMAVAKKVSSKLGNTPIMALQAYINPSVFAEWRL